MSEYDAVRDEVARIARFIRRVAGAEYDPGNLTREDLLDLADRIEGGEHREIAPNPPDHRSGGVR